jgi:hypothetical protein
VIAIRENPVRSSLVIRPRREIKLVGNSQMTNDDLVDFKTSDVGAADSNATNSNSSYGQSSDYECAYCQRTDCARGNPNNTV